MILTWVWNLKPWGYQKYTLPGICACIVAIVGAVGREDISHREDEAQQPGHEDSQDDLEWSRAESLLGNTSLPACTHHPKAAIARTTQNTCFNETALRVYTGEFTFSFQGLASKRMGGMRTETTWGHISEPLTRVLLWQCRRCDLIVELEPYRHLDVSL